MVAHTTLFESHVTAHMTMYLSLRTLIDSIVYMILNNTSMQDPWYLSNTLISHSYM